MGPTAREVCRDIALERLEAVPATTKCRDCKKRMKNHGKTGLWRKKCCVRPLQNFQ